MATDRAPFGGTCLRNAVAVACGVVGGSVVGASPLGAHTRSGAASLGDGIAHPLGGPDHLLAMVAVGILAVVAARLDRRLVWAVPAVFVGAMVAGGAVGLAGVVSEPVEPVVVGSVLALGVAIGVSGRRDPAGRTGPVLLVVLGLVAVAGLTHGHAHGIEATSGSHAAAYVVGFVAATIGLHAAGALTATLVRSRPALVTVLALGITAAGVGLLV